MSAETPATVYLMTYFPVVSSRVMLVIVTSLAGTPREVAIDGASTSVASAPLSVISVPHGTVSDSIFTVPTTGAGTVGCQVDTPEAATPPP